MARERIHVSRIQWGLAAACIAILAAVIFVVGSQPADVSVPENPADSVAAAPQFDRLLGRESARIELTVQRNAQTVSLTEIASSNPKVHIYSLN
jgi:hypothetical protein